MTAIAIVATLAGVSQRAYADSDASFIRLSGQSRYETAVEISKSTWSNSDSVVLAYGEDFPDGLAGVTLAYSKDAPILLTRSSDLPQSTLTEIQRLNAKNIYVLGGTGVISTNIEEQLKHLNYNVVRISGLNRFQTAIQVGKAIKKDSTDTAVIATAYNFPDTLSIGPEAARNGMPILFTDERSLTLDTRQALIDWKIKKVVIAGGTGVVSSQVESQIKALGISVERLSGSDRYETSLSIARRYNTNNCQDFVMAKGEDFPDALAGGALAAKEGLHILLTSSNNVANGILSYLDELKARDIYILGGTGAISENVKDYIKKGTFGSLGENIVNGGYVVKQGDWIYYCQYDPTATYPMAPDDSAIYKMKSDGTSKSRLVTVNARSLNIEGEWLYYINSTDYKIYAIKTDGSGKHLVSNIEVLNNMIIVGDWIYVNPYSGGILKISFDGSQYTYLWADSREFVSLGGVIYYNRPGDNDSIWSEDSNSNNMKLNDEPSYNVNVYRDRVYYNDAQGNICSISTSGGDKKTIVSDKVQSMIIDEGWIYYDNINDGDKLYKIRVDGTGRVKVSDMSIGRFNIIGNQIFYYTGNQLCILSK